MIRKDTILRRNSNSTSVDNKQENSPKSNAYDASYQYTGLHTRVYLPLPMAESISPNGSTNGEWYVQLEYEY